MYSFRNYVINSISKTVALMKHVLIERQLGIVFFQSMCS